jgi:hypothetical protein
MLRSWSDKNHLAGSGEGLGPLDIRPGRRGTSTREPNLIRHMQVHGPTTVGSRGTCMIFNSLELHRREGSTKL